MNTRAVIVQAAVTLLADSADGDISTRAVCQAAGVQQPTLYRLFGDKDGLLAAAVDEAFREYLASKRSTPTSDDTVADIRQGWQTHTQFALSHPNAYRLMFGAGLRRRPVAVQEAHDLLRELVARAAADGRLQVPVDVAVQTIMAANTGVALGLVTRPEQYPDEAVSAVVCDLILGAIFTHDREHRETLATRAAGLSATISATSTPALTTAEAGLLVEWCERLSAGS